MMSLFFGRTILFGCFVFAAFACSLYYFDFVKAFKEKIVPLGQILDLNVKSVDGQSNVPTWCGKAYMSTNASFNPGGWLYPPDSSSMPLLNLRCYPRMNLYLGVESSATLIIDAPLSYTVGQPICSSGDYLPATSVNSSSLHFSIIRADTGEVLVSDAEVSLNSTANEFEFPLSSFAASFNPYEILIKTISAPCKIDIQVVTHLSVLPPRQDKGSVVKLDYLYGSLLIQESSMTNTSWKPILPYSFYVSWGGYLNGSMENLIAFADLGYNIIHPVPGSSQTEPFDEPEFDQFLDALDEMGLYLMYDMRWTYQNITALSAQVERLRSRKSLLLWYSADEPDGWGDPLNATSLAYSTIKGLDPYHPISLVLNCYNFYFKEYTSGTDIILTDPYPVATNVTWSVQWNTPCNTTYGDCGCDNCIDLFHDIPRRMDTFRYYQEWIGNVGYRGPLPLWGVPQSFGGSEYWSRAPTAEEKVVLDLLFLNHGAKGLVAWTFPTTIELQEVTSQLAKVLTTDRVTSCLLGTNVVQLDVSGDDVTALDAAGWNVGGKILVSVVYMSYDVYRSPVSVSLPGVAGAIEILWPTMTDGVGWQAHGKTILKRSLVGLEVSLLLVDMQ